MDKEIYNSIFQEEIHDLIALKRALGFSYRAEAGSLRRIDTFYAKTIFPKSVSLKNFVIYGAEKELMRQSQIRQAVSVSWSGFLQISQRYRDSCIYSTERNHPEKEQIRCTYLHR